MTRNTKKQKNALYLENKGPGEKTAAALIGVNIL